MAYLYLKLNKQGVTRLVFIFRRFVIKIPNFTVQHDHFLSGCCANWNERKRWKIFHPCNDVDFGKKIAPTLFCSWFGLIQIQARCEILHRHLSEEEVEYFKDVTTDIKCQNFGYYKGRLVCVDYA